MAGLIPFNNRRHGLRRNGSNDLFNMIDDFFSESMLSNRNPLMDTFKVDVQDTDDNYLVEAELPGVNKKDIDLSLDNGYLTISVSQEENAENSDDENNAYIHKERRFSSMQRSLYLTDAKPDGVSAKLEDGLLKITVAKADNPDTSHKIEIE